MEKLKIYTMDCGWAGSITVISTSIDKARELMKDAYNYEYERDICEEEIADGWTFINLGDC